MARRHVKENVGQMARRHVKVIVAQMLRAAKVCAKVSVPMLRAAKATVPALHRAVSKANVKRANALASIVDQFKARIACRGNACFFIAGVLQASVIKSASCGLWVMLWRNSALMLAASNSMPTPGSSKLSLQRRCQVMRPRTRCDLG